MKFNLTAPCKDCPFRTGIPSQEGWLGYERAEGIAEAGTQYPQNKQRIP